MNLPNHSLQSSLSEPSSESNNQDISLLLSNENITSSQLKSYIQHTTDEHVTSDSVAKLLTKINDLLDTSVNLGEVYSAATALITELKMEETNT